MNRNREEKKIERIEQVLRRYFSYLMILIAFVGFVFFYAGYTLGNVFITGISTAVFSAATVGAIFKAMGYDVYLRSVLKEMIIDHKFLRNLNDQELKTLIKDIVIEMMDEAIPSSEIYDAFEKHLITDLTGIVTRNRSYNIVLEPDERCGEGVLRAKVKYSCNTINQSRASKPLFHDNAVCSGRTTIPLAMGKSKKPMNPEEVFSFKEFQIDDTLKNLDKRKIEWIDLNNWTNGVKHEIEYHKTLEPKQKVNLSYEEDFLVDKVDYVLREFLTFAEGTTQINITHPPGFKIKVYWFGAAKKPSVKVHNPAISSTAYSQSVDGVFFPGNGFLLDWKPTKTDET